MRLHGRSEFVPMATVVLFASSVVAASGQGASGSQLAAEACMEGEVMLDSLWEYADDRGRVQGPFSGRKLADWLSKVASLGSENWLSSLVAMVGVQSCTRRI